MPVLFCPEVSCNMIQDSCPAATLMLGPIPEAMLMPVIFPAAMLMPVTFREAILMPDTCRNLFIIYFPWAAAQYCRI